MKGTMNSDILDLPLLFRALCFAADLEVLAAALLHDTVEVDV